jgi:hypothetical protein
VTAPLFRTLTKEEYDRLDLDQRIEYMAKLIEHVRHLVEETRQQVEATKKKYPQS